MWLSLGMGLEISKASAITISLPSNASVQLLLHRHACLSACCHASHHDGDGLPLFRVALAMVSLHSDRKVTKTPRFARRDTAIIAGC